MRRLTDVPAPVSTSPYTAGVRDFIERQRAQLGHWPQTRDVAGRRGRYAHYARCFAIAEPEGGVAREDFRLESGGHALPVRVYRPRSCAEDLVILYFHGGGFVVGSIETHDSVTAFLAHHARAIVVSVDYRLAPEFASPSQLEDAVAALQWVRRRYGDRARVVAAGESAGATLAALLCERAARDPHRSQSRIDGQLLICPGPLSLSLDGDEFHAANTDPYLRVGDLEYYALAYLGPAGAAGAAQAFPLDAPGDGPMPPTLLYVAQHDPLRHQGFRYAEALRRRQASVRVVEGVGMIHSFIRVCSTDPAAADELARLCHTLAGMLALPREEMPSAT